jgi:DNA-binding transcriptional regulator YiaG
MNSDEYRAALIQLGLTQVGAAKLLGVDERTSRRWANGERDVPGSAARFLQYLIATRRTGAQAIRVLER